MFGGEAGPDLPLRGDSHPAGRAYGRKEKPPANGWGATFTEAGRPRAAPHFFSAERTRDPQRLRQGQVALEPQGERPVLPEERVAREPDALVEDDPCRRHVEEVPRPREEEALAAVDDDRRDRRAGVDDLLDERRDLSSLQLGHEESRLPVDKPELMAVPRDPVRVAELRRGQRPEVQRLPSVSERDRVAQVERRGRLDLGQLVDHLDRRALKMEEAQDPRAGRRDGEG